MINRGTKVWIAATIGLWALVLTPRRNRQSSTHDDDDMSGILDLEVAASEDPDILGASLDAAAVGNQLDDDKFADATLRYLEAAGVFDGDDGVSSDCSLSLNDWRFLEGEAIADLLGSEVID